MTRDGIGTELSIKNKKKYRAFVEPPELITREELAQTIFEAPAKKNFDCLFAMISIDKSVI